MPTVLVSAPYMIPFLDRFRSVFERYGLDLIVPEVKERLEEDEILDYADQFDGTICGDDHYTRKVLQACSPRLKVVSKWGTGIDSIDKQACEELGIMLANTPNAFTKCVADSVMGYTLAFARQGPWMDRAMKSGTWEKIPGRSLSESSLGIIGLGNIGKAVIQRAYPFEMAIYGNDIQEIDPGFIKQYQVKMVPLDDLLSLADFVSVNCDLNPSSYHLINEDAFKQMNPSSVLINTARGPIVDEKALVEVLTEGKIAGAALDVYEFEPLPEDSPLRKFNNVLLAPHNSNSSPRAWENVHWNTIRNLFDGLGITYDINEQGEIL